MRNLAECKAEILRRSETRIRACRARRNRLLAIAVPLCLTAAVIAAWRLPVKTTGNSAPPADGSIAEEEVGESMGSIGTVTAVIQYHTDEGTQQVTQTDSDVVASLLTALQAPFLAEDACVDETPIESVPEDNGTTAVGGAGHTAVYTVTVTGGDGSNTVYTLNLTCNLLTNRTTNENCTLTEEQATALLDILVS